MVLGNGPKWPPSVPGCLAHIGHFLLLPPVHFGLLKLLMGMSEEERILLVNNLE